MSTPRFHDLTDVHVEHLVGAATGQALVKLVVRGDGDVHLIGQLAPDQARRIAGHLFYAAARAEYDHDVLAGAKARGFDEQLSIAVLQMVREAEADRLKDDPS